METTAQPDLVTKMTLTAWNAQNGYLDKLLGELSEEQLMKEIAPGKNRGIYLLGHLIAVSDAMLPLLGFGNRLFPALEQAFLTTPDKAGQEMPSIAELKENLTAVNAKLKEHFNTTSSAQWLEKHNSVSVEDFVKEPHRNKLNIIISRTSHMANHIGQLLLLK